MHTPSFDLVVVGAGGGPDESNLSAYLLKPHSESWEDGIIALEAGSAQGALSRLLTKNPALFASGESDDQRYISSQIYSYVNCFLLTHAHLDHISGLVISAGSLSGPRKRVYALEETLRDLETVFSDRIWPNLASWKEEDDNFKLLYSTLEPNEGYRPISPLISVKTMPVSHGHNERGNYTSAVFFLKHALSSREFLFFGDVEPDSVARDPKTINVWRVAAPKIPDTLTAIFIECSWPSGRRDDMLYGHLTPEHLAAELEVLAKEVVSYRKALQKSQAHSRPPRKKQKTNALTLPDLKNALAGVTVYIIHCKDDVSGGDLLRPASQRIFEQVRTVVAKKHLGLKVALVEQGTKIGSYAFVLYFDKR